MALPQIVAQRRARALTRLNAIQEAWTGAGITSEQQPITNRDAEIAAVQQLENLANLCEATDQKIEAVVSALPVVDGAVREDGEHPLAYLTRYVALATKPEQDSEETPKATSESVNAKEEEMASAAEEGAPALPGDAPNVLPDSVTKLLTDNGFDTPEKIAAATDAQLNLPGIGAATLAKIRAFYPPVV